MQRTESKVTLDGSLVDYFDKWVGDQVGQKSILGMDFMVPAGICLNLADKTLCIPDEVRIGLAGRRPSYRSNTSAINLNYHHMCIPTGKSTKVRIGINPPRSKLWLRRDVGWVPTLTAETGNIMLLQLPKVGARDLVLNYWTPLAV